MNLTRRETEALDVLCDTFVPSLAFTKDEDPALFSMSAADLGVSARVAEALGRIEPAKAEAFRLFLTLLENPLFMATMAARPSRFSRLPQSAREEVLQRLARSVVPQLRSAYQGARSLVMLHTYAANGTPESAAILAAIGYKPEINQKATGPRIPVSKPAGDAKVECDVCVVGSGAAGSVVAAELAANGQNVIVVEAGGAWSDGEFDQHELIGMQRLFREGGLSGTRDLSMSLLAGTSIGGGTTVNWQSCFRTPDDVRDEWAELSGCAFFESEVFTDSLDAVWRRIGASTDESEINENNSAISRGAQSLGYRWSVIARNSLGCDDAQCGNCMFGCRVGGKQSASTTYLMDAIRSGAQVIAPYAARRLIQSKGKVTGVEGTYSDPQGTPRTLAIVAPRVVLAAGALETPALLMRSGLKSLHVGQHLFLHPTVAVTGRYPSPIEAWKGAPQTIVCDEFSNLSEGYGYRIEAAPAHPGLLSVGLPWWSAREHRRKMQNARHVAPFIVLTRDSNEGQVRITKAGQPYFDYRLGKEEKRLLRHGMAAVARIHHAAGADQIFTLHTQRVAWERDGGGSIDKFCREIEAAPTSPNRLPLFSAHQMGTARIGTDKATAVCDPHGAVFGMSGAYVADASLFPSSSGVNPMVTIMALARCIARGLLRQLREK
jgi:choline dehydrogenase-like flavoprotein